MMKWPSEAAEVMLLRLETVLAHSIPISTLAHAMNLWRCLEPRFPANVHLKRKSTPTSRMIPKLTLVARCTGALLTCSVHQ